MQSIEAAAKVNLSFEVLRRLPTGYHEIRSLVTAISLHDTLSAELSDELTLRVELPTESKYRRPFLNQWIPTDSSNLVLRAASLLQQRSLERGRKVAGASIILTKRIPAQAGLGGGSSDAAAALILLNALWQTRFTRDELRELGAELGCDVPLFFQGFPVICRGLGERLESVPDGAAFPTLYFVVAKPLEGCSTPEVYRRCVPYENQDEQILIQMIHAWRESRLTDFARGLQNGLLAAAVEVSSSVECLLNSFREIPDPCLGVSMTGSGSACFGLCRDRVHAVEAANFLEQHFSGTVFVAETELSERTVLR